MTKNNPGGTRGDVHGGDWRAEAAAEERRAGGALQRMRSHPSQVFIILWWGFQGEPLEKKIRQNLEFCPNEGGRRGVWPNPNL